MELHDRDQKILWSAAQIAVRGAGAREVNAGLCAAPPGSQ